jgi:hypothetical protein
VHVARVFGQPPQPGLCLVAPPDAALGKRPEERLRSFAALLTRPGPDDLDGLVESLRVTAGGDLGERALA